VEINKVVEERTTGSTEFGSTFVFSMQ